MRDGAPIQTTFLIRVPHDLKKRFVIECRMRDTNASHMIRDYIKKQLKYWDQQQSARPD